MNSSLLEKISRVKADDAQSVTRGTFELTTLGGETLYVCSDFKYTV